MNGKTINGFTLQYQLGKGGMAEVWYAENMIHKKAAVKILNEELSHNELIVDRFRNEAEIMVKLNHPNIRQVYDYGEIDGRPAIVMEYLDGADLKARMKQGQHFSDEQLRKWWDQLVSALNYTHQKGIVHRDIKPGNIFVDHEGNIKLLDFGIAKVRESISSTQTGQKLGTLLYMSPEQVKDSKHTDYRTDIYSLAVTFVHLITGRPPYDCDTTSDFEISEKIVYTPLDLSEVPLAWRPMLASYLGKDPQQRDSLKPFTASVPQNIVKETVEDDATFVPGSVSSMPNETPTAVETPKVEPRPEKPRPTEKPQATETVSQKPTPMPQKEKKGKKKTGLWIALGIAAAAVVALLCFLIPSSSKDALFPYQDGEYIGFIDKSGKTVISAKYESFSRSESTAGMRVFSEGLACVEQDGLYGYINTEGEMVIPARFVLAECFSEGRAFVIEDWDDGGKWGVIDTKGNYIVRPKFDSQESFSEGLARVTIDDEAGFINKDGEYVIRPKYENAHSFSEGLAPVSEDGDEWGYIDKNGKYAIKPKFDYAYRFSEGLARVEVDGEEGFINKDGTFVISPKYYRTGEFKEGLAMAKEDSEELWGYIDKKGKYVINPKFDDAYPFSEGLALVLNEDGLWGFIDKSGAVVIPFQYDYATPFWEGVAFVIKEDKYSYLDKKGNAIKSFYLE